MYVHSIYLIFKFFLNGKKFNFNYYIYLHNIGNIENSYKTENCWTYVNSIRRVSQFLQQLKSNKDENMHSSEISPITIQAWHKCNESTMFLGCPIE